MTLIAKKIGVQGQVPTDTTTANRSMQELIELGYAAKLSRKGTGRKSILIHATGNHIPLLRTLPGTLFIALKFLT